MLSKARQAFRRQTWVPPTAIELLEVLSDSNKRLVRTDSELLDAVIESLERLQDRLQGANPIVRILWNESRSCRSPKEENFFSDVVRDHLEQDLVHRGVAAQREVEIRRLNPKAPIGERGDILVAGTSLDPHDVLGSVTVVVESKGCWESRLETAMEDQLRQRYLIGRSH